jgi:peptidyl-prolyl cis-trans isomerase B (cyclophilin B)
MHHGCCARRTWLCLGLSMLLIRTAAAQSTQATQLAIIEAEERGATSPRDLMTLRSGTRSNTIQTVRMAVRALGRTERPAQISDIVPSLRHMLPEVRVEAANAIAQAAQGFRSMKTTTGPVSVASTQSTLIARLDVEAEATVRAALCEAIARLPYKSAPDIERAETVIVSLGSSATATTQDRLGVAKSLEALFRMHRSIRPAGPAAIELLKSYVRQAGTRSDAELLREARVRRLALEGLTSANALDEEMVTVAATDPDAQVRRLAMRAAAISGAGMASVSAGLLDPAALVRLEALRALRSRNVEHLCEAALKASADSDMEVALVAIDQLDACGNSPDAVAALERAVNDRSELEAQRGWHRNAHALVALAVAAPSRAMNALPPYLHSPIWQVRSYAARAATSLNDRAALQALADDPDERVANVAVAGLGAAPRPHTPSHAPDLPPPTAEDLKRLASPRATITIRDVGRFEVALLTSEAPATVMRFVQLAESGYYNGLTFDRIAPNAIIQGGRRIGDEARFPHPEVGTWPHVRGVLGLSMPDTNDAQFFVDLVDNPRFDHQYTVFAQILNGADVVDQLLEGDVIESITITP